MKAPDKIYVDTEVIAFYDLELKGKEDIEYIRKDALLDIIKEQKKIAMGFSYEHLQMIEDKIKEL